MSENIKKNYFSIIKFICILLLLIYFILMNTLSIKEASVKFFLLTCIVAINAAYEIVTSKKYIFLFIEIFLSLLYVFVYGNDSLLLLPFILLDTFVYFHAPAISYLTPYLGILAYNQEKLLYFILCTFAAILYYQNFVIIAYYRKNISSYEYEESKLKDHIDYNQSVYHKELEQNLLTYENNMLEEKTRISQALHDKLGHSINGSIYQLEASKVIMENSPVESKKIIQAVIDNLRGSMDEIRVILRKEKPDKSKSSYIQLINLCNNCREKYSINAEVVIEGDKSRISEKIWEVILDNSVESITNSLKYAECENITITILILNKIIRFNIKDDGIGCTNMEEGMGLQGIKERTKKMNGIVDIHSDVGFEINTIIPIDHY